MTREELIQELEDLQARREQPPFELVEKVAEPLGMPLAELRSEIMKNSRPR